MSRFARLRHHPYFSGYFDDVHPLFWLVLVWQLIRVCDEMDARRVGHILLRVYWWGGIEVTFWGDPKPDPSAYKPLEPSRAHWSDPVWESATPETLLGLPARPILPRSRGRCPKGAEGACALAPIADTS